MSWGCLLRRTTTFQPGRQLSACLPVSGPPLQSFSGACSNPDRCLHQSQISIETTIGSSHIHWWRDKCGYQRKKYIGVAQFFKRLAYTTGNPPVSAFYNNAS